MTTRVALLTLCLVTFTRPVAAADWPQWRGPRRTGASEETGLLRTWPDQGPPLRWAFADAGVGFSGPAVVGDRLYTLGARDDAEYVFALDARSGREVWR